MASTATPTRDDFAALLDESLGAAGNGGFEGRVVKGTVTAIENGYAVIDVGLKSEGRVNLKEFARGEDDHGLTVGDEVEVYVCLLYTSPSPRDLSTSRMPSSA